MELGRTGPYLCRLLFVQVLADAALLCQGLSAAGFYVLLTFGSPGALHSAGSQQALR